MPYRQTERVERKRQQTRERVEWAAQSLVSEGGYQAVAMSAVAERAGVGVGTVYRQFPSKAELLAVVFRRAASREMEAVQEAIGGKTHALDRLEMAAVTFARRALAGRRLAWALLAEPVDPLVEAERLVFRQNYRDLFATVIADGVARGELPEQESCVCAAALVGALAEVLVGPLSPTSAGIDESSMVTALVRFCQRSLTDREVCHVTP